MKNLCFSSLAIFLILCLSGPAEGFVPYPRNLWDMMMPLEDPFKVLEQAPLTIPKPLYGVSLARVDWKETPNSHVISLDVPGVKKEDIKIEIEENRVLRITGERKSEEETEGDKWHRAERSYGKFWRQFRLPGNADVDTIKAHLEDGVLRITIQKITEEKKRQPRLVNIVQDVDTGDDIKATKAEM